VKISNISVHAFVWAAAFGTTAAHAQSAPAAEVPPAEAVQDAGDGDIIVTAQRREERLQDVPIAISAFSGDALQSAGISSTNDLTQITPSLNFTQSSFSPQPTIRGLGTRGVSAGDESLVPVYIDGVYQPFLGSVATELNNIARVEVLKGPQSALFGRNSTGGAINIVTHDPDGDEELRGSLSYGSFDERIAKLYVNGGDDVVAANVAFSLNRDDGYIKDLNGGPDKGWVNTWALRSKLRVRPNDSLDLILAYNRVERDDTLATGQQPFNNNTVTLNTPGVILPTRPNETSGRGGELNLVQDTASLTLRADLGFANLVAITAYDNAGQFIDSDVDSTNIERSRLPVTYYTRSWIQELYLTGETGPVSWIAGATLFNQDAGNKRSQVITNGNPTGPGSSDVTSNIDNNSIALYAQASIDFTDRLSLTLGGRYTNERKVFDITNNLTGQQIHGRQRWQVFTPSATLQYRLNDDANIYAKAGKGFKSGVFPASTLSPNPVDPEEVWQYELGTKLRVAGWLNANFAAFYTDYSNMQVNIRVNNISSLQNAGSAEIYGVEGELFGRPLPGLNLRLGFSKLWGEFTDFPNAVGYVPLPNGGNQTVTIDATGNKIIRTPLFSLNAGFDYEHELSGGNALLASANLYHAGKSYRDADNRIVEGSRTLVNGEIGFRLADPRITFSLWGRNVLDETYTVYVLVGPSTDSALYGRPRSFGGRVSFEF
jgi:iron complex outermembrane receptor protein